MFDRKGLSNEIQYELPVAVTLGNTVRAFLAVSAVLFPGVGRLAARKVRLGRRVCPGDGYFGFADLCQHRALLHPFLAEGCGKSQRAEQTARRI